MIGARHAGAGAGTLRPGLWALAVSADLIVDEQVYVRLHLGRSIEQGGAHPVAVADPREAPALALLEFERRIALVLGDVGMLTAAGSLGTLTAAGSLAFIRTARRCWSAQPPAAVTHYPSDLDGLPGSPE